MPKFISKRFIPDGGLNEDENPHSLKDNELSTATNVGRRGETVGTRPGIEREASGQQYETALSGGEAIRGMYEFRRNADANRTLGVVAGTKLYTDDATSVDLTATLTNVTAGAANTVTFATHKQTMYVSGNAVGDDFWSYSSAGVVTDLTAANTIVNGSAADVVPVFIFEKWNRLFACRFYESGTTTLQTDSFTNPMIVRYSVLDDGTIWPLDNLIGGASTIGGFSSDGGEFLTGFGEFTDNNGDWLLALSNKRLYAISETGDSFSPFSVSRRGAIANGCVHQNAFVTLGLDTGDAIYLSNRGIHSLRQSQQFGARERTFLSWKIRKTFATLNQSKLHRAVAAFDPEEGRVLFAVPTGSNDYNDTILALDVKGQDRITADDARWSIWKLGSSGSSARMNALLFAKDQTDEPYIYGGTEAGDVVRFSRVVYSDLGSSYKTHMVTKHDNLGAPGVFKGIGDIWVDIQPGGSYTPIFKIIYDHGRATSGSYTLKMMTSAATWDDVNWNEFNWASNLETLSNHLYGVGSGDTIALEFTHSGLNQPFWIAQVAYQVQGLGESIGEAAA